MRAQDVIKYACIDNAGRGRTWDQEAEHIMDVLDDHGYKIDKDRERVVYLEDKLKELRDYVETELGFANNPGPYMDSHYYIECEAKARILEDIQYQLQEIEGGGR